MYIFKVYFINMANSNVNIYDPLDIITNGSQIYNKIPDAENLFIYAEMNAVRRGSSVLMSTNGLVTQELNSMNSDITVSLLGHDENGNYTTKYSDNIANSPNIQYEGFGMTEIKIKMNSSYIPMVSVEFVDVRGNSFFNNSDKSPYRILFDFPPPIFQLTVKGYYGKPLRYQLHLVRTNTKFNSDTGNYHISAEFIANTFAPLTDLLFKYIEIIPMIDDWNNGVSMGSDFKSKPKHVYQLLYKLGNLYDNVNDVVKNSTESDNFNNAKSKYNKISDLINGISGFGNTLGNYVKSSRLAIYILNDDMNLSTLNFINQVSEYDKYSQSYGQNIPDSPNELLLLTIKTNPLPGNQTAATDVLNKYVSNLLKEINASNITDISDKDYSIKTINYPLNSDTIYVSLDISKLHMKLYRNMVAARADVSKTNETLNNTLNKIAITELGFKPTIGKIFEILCNDIDLTFDKLRDVAKLAEDHHEKYKSKILSGGYRDNGSKIRAFPLFVETQIDNNGTCVTQRQVRTIPKFNGEEKFPEIEFIDEFINAFIKNKKANLIDDLKTQTDENGNNKWMPISPLDSPLIPGGGTESPYRDLNAPSIFTTFLNRYYVYTQHVLANNFYEIKGYDKLFAESEALNIANSIIDDNLLIPQLKNICDIGISDPLGTLSGQCSNFSTIDNNVITIGNTSYYNPKSNPNFKGVELIKSVDIIEKNLNDSNDPTNDFIETNSKGFWNGLKKYFLDNKIYDAKFNKENITYFKDTDINNKYDSNYYISSGFKWIGVNDDFATATALRLVSNPNLEYNANLLINILSGNTVSTAIKYGLISSALGNIRTPNQFPNLYNISSILEVPSSIPILFGACLNIDLNELNSDIVKELFNYDSSTYLSSKWWEFLVSNSEYLQTNLSELDKQLFKSYYENFNSQHSTIIYDYIEMLKKSIDVENPESISDMLSVGGSYDGTISKLLNERIFMAILSDIAFIENSGSTYQSIPNVLSSSTNKNKVNTNLFKLFFQKLKSRLDSRANELNDITKNLTDSINDNDIKTQLYYSFKNIVDKWIVDVGTESPLYLGSGGNNDKHLINRFAFVDRAMNDIGGIDDNTDGCIIGVDGLREVAKDFDTNVFSMFSRILSDNNFEFFPLQNFMSFTGNEWEDAFKIHNTIQNNVNTSPSFICMYVGGTSSILNTGNKNYVDDGILDLQNDSDLLDFQGNDCNKSSNDNNFKYSNVKAFKVKFGQQNQSIFKDIELDSTEFSETNESLAILSKISNDESSASPVPKGQNLFNTYENRSYTAKINMLGNAMIQPTQYFQLENVPMYSGAYLIINTEHTIQPNNMSTTFTGTRIAKYPKPIVTEFAKSVLSQGSSIDDYTSSTNSGSPIGDITSENLPSQAKYNAMFTLKI